MVGCQSRCTPLTSTAAPPFQCCSRPPCRPLGIAWTASLLQHWPSLQLLSGALKDGGRCPPAAAWVLLQPAAGSRTCSTAACILPQLEGQEAAQETDACLCAGHVRPLCDSNVPEPTL